MHPERLDTFGGAYFFCNDGLGEEKVAFVAVSDVSGSYNNIIAHR